ncbi:TonB-dependent receptor [Parapedobacter sp. GCM10030251]|uniref:TonB-dependent receptor n=1 Tax=Parapedobacter sp. GCM10030251 TaxID=3273419 RepID=UPI00362040C7
MKRFISTLLLLLATMMATAQTSELHGSITVPSGTPVVGASLRLQPGNRDAMTDERGRYAFVNIPYGDYELEITSLEIQPVKIRLTINQTRQRKNIIVNVQESTQLDEANVSRNSEKRAIETQGFAVAVVETKEASVRNIQTNELLDRTVGVRVRQNGGLGSNVVYNLNGMSGRAVGIFIDGIEISTYGSSFNLNNIPPAMIERIEVYKGVLPAHLSGDLLGGAINIIMKKGTLNNNLTASVSYGSFNTQQADLSGMYRNSSSGFTMRASGFYSYSDNDYEVWGPFVRNESPTGVMEPTRGKRFNDAFKSYGGRFEFGFTGVTWADNFMLGYVGSDTYNEVQHGQYMTRPYMGRFTESQAHVFSLNYTKKDLLLQGLEFSFNGVYSDRDQYIQDTVSWRYNWSGEKIIDIHGKPFRSREGAQQGRPTMNNINRRISTVRAGLNYTISRHHKVVLNHVFYTVDREDYDQLRTVLEQNYRVTNDLSKNVSSLAYEMQAFDSRLKTNIFGKLYQQKIDRVEPVSEVVNGQNVRVEKHLSDNRNTVGYGLAASFAVKPNLILITSAEKAVRMPDESEIFGDQAQNMTANLSIRPEFSNNFNLGIRAGSYHLNNHVVSLSVSGFIRDTKDKIAILSNDRSVTNVETLYQVNLAGVQAIGFEAEAGYSYQKLNVMLNVSRFNSVLKDEASLYNDRQIPNDPFFTANGNIRYRLENTIQKQSAINLYYNAGYVHPFETIWKVRPSDTDVTPPQFIQDIGISYLFPNRKLTLSFDAKNIFNREAYDNFAAQKPGRSFYVKLNYTINKF